MATSTVVTTIANDGDGSLRAVINGASSDDTITFDSSIYNKTITLTSQIDIIKALTISGIGANITISGNKASRVFTIAANTTVTINGITIINGATRGGCAIYNAGTLTITKSTLSSNNNSVGYGGAIYSVGTLAITDSTLSNNSSGINGGAIYSVGTLAITDSTLSNNSSGSYGGAIYSEGILMITRSTFSGNTTDDSYGGAIYRNSEGTFTITDSVFSGNATNGEDGGAIYNDAGELRITNSTFSGNSGDDGGAIYNDEGELRITNSTFSSNIGSYGGAIYNNDNGFTITSSTFSDNISDYDGAAIYNSYTLTITNSTFSNNRVRKAAGYGGAIENSGTLTITNSTFSGNAGAKYGGAIYNSGILNIVFSTIVGNQASSGGGIYNAESNITVKNSLIANNTNSNYAGSGTFSALGVNFSTDDTCLGFWQVSSDALNLGPLAENLPGVTMTHALLSGSVAIDAVTECTDLTGNEVTTDQRGVSRPQLNACDAGSYEYDFANITLSPATLAYGIVGISYNAIITASGGTPPYTFSITAGSLPGGLSLSSNGSIFGIPVNPGIFNFTITATDKNNHSGSQTYSIAVSIRRLSFQGFNWGHRRRRRRLRTPL